jgi:hypothetical protein
MIKHLIVVLVGLSLTSCISTEPEEIDYGPEFSQEDVLVALQSVQTKKTPLDIKQGEFVHKSSFVIVGASSAISNDAVGLTVTRRELTESDLELTLVEELVTIENEEEKRYIREHFNTIPITALQNNKIESLRKRAIKKSETNDNVRWALAPYTESEGRLVPDEDDSPPYKVTYHNLKVTSHKLPPPKEVKESEGCQGLANCELSIKQLVVDIVIYYLSGRKEKETLTIWMSDNAPYLASTILECTEKGVKLEGRTVMVKQCVTVDDFRAGSL